MKRRIGIWLVALTVMLTACGNGSDPGNATVSGAPEETGTARESGAQVQDAEIPADVWVMEEAPAIRKVLSEEERQTKQKEILEEGTFLFAGKENEGYYPGDISWLHSAEEPGAVALIFSCEDETHGGWGVLGMSVTTDANGRIQEDIAAYSDEPKKERLLLYSMDEILRMAGAEKKEDITAFSLGAWNGGKIVGLYYLPGDVANELRDYLAEV